MRIHNQIRKEVLDYLVANMKGIKSFYNGIPKITNVKAELPLICVTLENAQAEQHVVGGQEWEADLNIMILAPFGGSEPVLDELAEEVYQLLKIQSFKSISMKYAQGYDYEYDDEREWVNGVISFHIHYNFEWINGFNLETQEG